MGHLVSRPAPAKHGCREARSYVSSLSLWDAYQVAVRDVAKALEVCLEHILARDSFWKTREENPIVCRLRLAHSPPRGELDLAITRESPTSSTRPESCKPEHGDPFA